MVLFSGDAPGMNPFLRVLVWLGLKRYNIPPVGGKEDYRGLERPFLAARRHGRRPGPAGRAHCAAPLWRTAAG